jgi:RNA polymerase sigma factor (sigma-70 family)
MANFRHLEYAGSTDTAPKGGAFVTTHWSVVLAAGKVDAAAAISAMDTLCRLYWQPVYAFIRRSGTGEQDARDLTQAFFAKVLKGGQLGHAQPERGRFRSYLLSILKNFLADEHDRSQALKRGGQIELVPLDPLLAESRYGLEASGDATPDVAYDRAWALSVLDRALSRLREEFTLSGRAVLFDGLKPLLVGDSGNLTFTQVSARLQVTEGAAKMAVKRMRERFRVLVRQELTQTMIPGEELDQEIQVFLALLNA